MNTGGQVNGELVDFFVKRNNQLAGETHLTWGRSVRRARLRFDGTAEAAEKIQQSR